MVSAEPHNPSTLLKATANNVQQGGDLHHGNAGEPADPGVTFTIRRRAACSAKSCRYTQFGKEMEK
jgi:hypothetical protein